VMSAKTTVTTLRASRPGAGLAVRTVPQFMQKRAASGLEVPQLGHVITAWSLGAVLPRRMARSKA
jgi:hypothetical protein